MQYGGYGKTQYGVYDDVRSSNWLLSFKGRCKRLSYFVVLVCLNIAGTLAGWWASYYQAILFLVVPLMFWISLAVCAQRLHDMDLSGWWQALPIVSIAGASFFVVVAGVGGADGLAPALFATIFLALVPIGFALFLLFKPGNPYDNEYGLGERGRRPVIADRVDEAAAQRVSSGRDEAMPGAVEFSSSISKTDVATSNPAATVEARLTSLRDLYEKGLVTEAAYQEKQTRIISDL